MHTPRALSIGHPCLCPHLSPSFPVCKWAFSPITLQAAPVPSYGEFVLCPLFRWDSRVVAGSMVGDLDEARAAAGCLTHTCSSTRGGWRLPASCRLLHPLGPRGGPYMPTSALGTQRGTAARNPSMCHVRSKLRFFLRAWAKPSFWGERRGSGWGLGLVPRGGSEGLGLWRQPPPPRAGGRMGRSARLWSLPPRFSKGP